MPADFLRTACALRLAIVLSWLSHAAFGVVPETVDFNLHVRPILSDRCFACHGPDENSRKAKLRLDIPESTHTNLHSGKAIIIPGDPTNSELVRRITSVDPDFQMPPPESKLKLHAGEIQVLKRWIEQGAEYKSHWSFIPIADVPIPPVKDTAWPKNPIDNFILHRLESEGLSPSQPAARETLIRRLSFGLRGLPPTLEEIDAFVEDETPLALEQLVAQFLASPRYGEWMAQGWLDLARFADTYGYQADVDRDLSPWRDWVIRAFNDNLSFDQFLTWQIAGDLLPNATKDQILATAFNRLHRQTNEGGSIEEEFRVEYVADRLHTYGTAFLGLTLECSRCHDHKYDPITQKNYYELFAFFNNIDESGLYSHFTRATPTPTLLLYPDGMEDQHRELKTKIASAEKELAQIREHAVPDFERWRAANPAVPLPEPIAHFPFDEVHTNTTPNVLEPGKAARLSESPMLIKSVEGNGFRFNGENSVTCPELPAFSRTDPFTISLWVKPGIEQARTVILHQSRAWTDSGSRGWELLLDGGRPHLGLVHFWPGNAIAIAGLSPLPLGEWSHLTISYDGSSRASGLRIYKNGELFETKVVRDHLYKDILHRKEWGDSDAGNIRLKLAARFRDSGFKDGELDELLVFDRCLTAPEVRLLHDPHAKPADSPGLLEHFLAHHHDAFKRVSAELGVLRKKENQLVNDVPEIMVMQEMAQRRPTHLLKRGSYESPGEPVQPSTPERILPFGSMRSPDRLGLAQWTVSAENPLTARVAVNRVWALHFGRGIVPTLENFGSQGQLPSHPELLDWLAKWFVENNWNGKALHKLIVTSATYCQSSEASRDLLLADSDNELLARGPKRRLDAESIRDSALAISHLLSTTLGGPSVKPYQPPGVWEDAGTGKSYSQDKGEKLYRRSLYTFWRRTAPPPSMMVFDAPSREVCTARREVTTTPLQALVLLNDPQFIEAARVLAEQIVRQCSTPEARVERAFRAVLGRRPDQVETEIAKALYQEQFALFTNDLDSAKKLAGTGERPVDARLPEADVAATTVLAAALMNHDEFVVLK